MKILSFLFSLLLPVSLVADQADAGKARPKRAPNPAFAPVADVEGLPRVLLIGDSISMGYTLAVRELLQGKANVHRIPENGGPSSRGVEKLEQWLGDGEWDLIHFNFGLHDLVYMGAGGQRRVEPSSPGAVHQVPLDEYEKNLSAIVSRLQETGAKLIWCATTPVPEGSGGRVAGEAVEFNAVAARVMESAGVPVNDLHGYALAELEEIQRPANVHFTDEGSSYLAQKVAEVIEKSLAE